MRLFTGIDLPAGIAATLVSLVGELRPAARLQWSPSANLHITTRFIGEWPDGRLPDLRAALERISKRPAIPIHVHELGFSPNPHSPRTLWAGIEASPDLAALAAETDRVLETLGLKPEGRPFKPHLTLARIKDPVRTETLREAIAALPSLEFGSFNADRFHLYRSRTGPAGSVYTQLAEFPL
jgi:2'-5' RNA ligase